MKTDRSRESLTRGQQVIACLALSSSTPLGPHDSVGTKPSRPQRRFAIVGGERCKILHLDAPPLRSAIFLYKFPYSCAPPAGRPQLSTSRVVLSLAVSKTRRQQ